MSFTVLSVDAVSATPQVVSREVRPSAAQESHTAAPKSADDTRQAVASALKDGGNQIAFGGHTAQFSYDAEADRVVVRIYSSDSQPRELIRQIPPEEYVSFVTRFRQMLGALLDHKI
jgi:uncharacterized FlaG/YvyC family protein